MTDISFVAAPSVRDGAVVTGRRADGPVEKNLRRLGFKGKEGEAVTLSAPPAPLERLVVLGLGKKRPDSARLRRLGGALAVELAPMQGGAVSVALDLEGAEAAELAYGYLLRANRPLSKYRTRPDDDDPGPGPAELAIGAADPVAAEARWRRLEPVARGAFLARDLAAEPGNALGPAEMAERIRLLSRLGVDVEILDPAAHGLNLLAAIGQGSARLPLLAVMRWNGAGGKTRPLALVGKGITFDSGGISIKPGEHMEAMKGDMAGAAAVIGTLAALAGRNAPIDVAGVVALAENMPSGGALRPGDVVKSYSGLTVEVIDTDAEGRLALADALAWTARNLDPSAVIDLATLTGAVVRTLGRHRAGLYANHDGLAKRLLECGEAEEERLWRLPLSARCDEDLESDIADLKNCAWESPVACRVPDADDAARFLEHFVPKGLRWAHLDIAGTADSDEDLPLCPKGFTGFGVRLLDRLADAAQTGRPRAKEDG